NYKIRQVLDLVGGRLRAKSSTTRIETSPPRRGASSTGPSRRAKSSTTRIETLGPWAGPPRPAAADGPNPAQQGLKLLRGVRGCGLSALPTGQIQHNKD